MLQVSNAWNSRFYVENILKSNHMVYLVYIAVLSGAGCFVFSYDASHLF